MKFKEYLNQRRQDSHDCYTQNFWGPSWLGKVADDFENKRQDLFERWTGFDKVKGMEEKHQLIITNHMDLVTIFYGSAKEFDDPTWLNHLSAGGGHYYGNTGGLFADSTTCLKTK